MLLSRIIINGSYCMQQQEKKKRTRSGSRSKSHKNKPNDFSVELRSKQLTNQSTEPCKIKTQNSSSLNKSRPSRKTSTKQQKKHTKSHKMELKDQPSHSVSADRKHSLMKMNKTEANYDHYDLESKLLKLKAHFQQIERPPSSSLTLLQDYYQGVRQTFANLEQPLYSFCAEMHSLYTQPLKKLFEMMGPYEELLRKKEELRQLIDLQVAHNEQMFSKMDPTDLQIFRLKEKIEEQRVMIQEKRAMRQELEKMTEHFKEVASPEARQEIPVKKDNIEHIGRGLKLNLDTISNKEGQLGFHQQFYSKIQEFSESWRDQALREKRF